MDKIHQLNLTSYELEELKDLMRNGKGDYVAGLLIGRLEQTFKWLSSNEPLKEEDLTKPL